MHCQVHQVPGMMERKAISVSLTPKLHGFVRDLVGTGSHTSASEVTRSGLRLLQEREAGIVRRPPGQLDAAKPG